MHTKLVRLLTSSLHATPIINCCRGSKDFIEKLRAKRKACTSKWDEKCFEGAFLSTLNFGSHLNPVTGGGRLCPLYTDVLIKMLKAIGTPESTHRV